MDLLSEGSNEPRILTARHLSGKTLPETNNAVNTTLICYNYSLAPDVGTYLAALGTYAWVTWACGALVLAAICLLYAATLRAARQHWRMYYSNVAVVVAIYPVVAAASLVAIIVPRACVLCEALAQQIVMVALYHFFCMILAECGGPDKLVRMSDDAHWQTRVLPCCCWPCCVLPQPVINARNLTWLRYTILQVPIVQGLLYFIILVLWAEDMALYLKSYPYLQPLVGASILSGVWGVAASVRTAETLGARPRPRLLAVQLALLVVKLQCGLVRAAAGFWQLPCVMSLHPAVFVNLVQNCVIIVEMLVLSLWAHRLYGAAGGAASGARAPAAKDGVENKSYK